MKSCYVLVAVLMTASFVQAKEYVHKDSGLQFELPKGWTCQETKGELQITSADKKLHLSCGVVPAENAKAVMADIKKFLAQLDVFNNVKVTGGPEKEEVNELEQAWYEGTASIKNDTGEEEEVEWDLTVITGGKKVLFLMGIGDLDKNEKKYEAFFESIAKVEEDEDE